MIKKSCDFPAHNHLRYTVDPAVRASVYVTYGRALRNPSPPTLATGRSVTAVISYEIDSRKQISGQCYTSPSFKMKESRLGGGQIPANKSVNELSLKARAAGWTLMAYSSRSVIPGVQAAGWLYCIAWSLELLEADSP